MAASNGTTYDVRIWEVRPVVGKTRTTYELRWKVARKARSKSFGTRALANSRRAELLSAVNRGEPFDVESGLPVSQRRDRTNEISWWEWVLTYVDTKWPTLAPSSRRSMVEALVTCTIAMLDPARRGRPSEAELRSAMTTWAFVPTRRKAGPPTSERAHRAVAWLAKGTRPVIALDDPTTARKVLDAVVSKKDGTPAAPTTIARKRAVLYNVLDLAVEQGIFAAHPLDRIRWKAPKVAEGFDPRSVVNPTQARALLEATRKLGSDAPEATRADRAARRHGRHLTAFFGCMYYAALRPSEARGLRLGNLDLPTGNGWGQLVLEAGDPEISGTWTDGGRRTRRQLKHRALGAIRLVPCAPALVQLLQEHLDEFGTAPDQSLFRGPAGGRLLSGAYNRAWRDARRAVLQDADESPLALRPYDLRHTAVSTWLAAGVPSTQVAAWAGHSVAVLHRVYAHVVADSQAVAQGRIDAFLGGIHS
ncbi:tyrosine-type recombinase/integrase [Kineosporia sp. A_224]|uniref:tyrosine-type recombinase/integrase n=1 Tax=Kineosporia sp. A_224 TaxID=1962180 RepID=UPI000B4A6B68|nr:tyrosine-type recombinase/integrase [Kineosporia sp. A_224]